MPSIDLNCRVWSDKGTKPAKGDETYTGGVQPVAAWDNNFNWSVSKDLHNLNDQLGELDDLYLNVSGDTMEGPLIMDTHCIEYNSGWELCNSSNGIAIEDGEGDDNEFNFTTDSDGNAVHEIDGYTSWHEGNFDPDDYWTKTEAEDLYLNVDGSDQMEASLDVGGHKIEAVNDVIEFTSANGGGLDFTANSDGNHHLFKHTDGDGTGYSGQLNSGNGQILELEEEGSYRHRFGTNGNYRNTGSIHSSGIIQTDSAIDLRRSDKNDTGFRFSAGDNQRPYIAPTPQGELNYGDELYWQSGEWTFETQLNVEGNVDLHDNNINSVESILFEGDPDQSIYYEGNSGDFRIRDGDNSDIPFEVGPEDIKFDRDTDYQSHSINGIETVSFDSPSGTALDLTPNADGNHYLWNHGTGSWTTSSSQLAVGNGEIQNWRLNDDKKHVFYNDGGYENWGGADFRGDVHLHDNVLQGVETLSLNPDPHQVIQMDSSQGDFELSDSAGGVPLEYSGSWWSVREARTRFTGGSVYIGNTNGEINDSYDLAWQNNPSGNDFRVHMKEDPEQSSLTGHYGMMFSTNGDHDGPLIACEVNKGRVHTQEIRSHRQNQSGTPIAYGNLSNQLDVGEICYEPHTDSFIGRTDSGVVTLGE